jgi:hypothetical protein
MLGETDVLLHKQIYHVSVKSQVSGNETASSRYPLARRRDNPQLCRLYRFQQVFGGFQAVQGFVMIRQPGKMRVSFWA